MASAFAGAISFAGVTWKIAAALAVHDYGGAVGKQGAYEIRLQV